MMCAYKYVQYQLIIRLRSTSHQKKSISHQVVIRSDPKQLSEVAERHRGVVFKPEVRIVVGRSEVTAFTEWSQMGPTGRVKEVKKVHYILATRSPWHEPTWGKRCFPPRKSPASTHLSPAWSWGCLRCIRCPAGWTLAKRRKWSGGGRHRKEPQRSVAFRCGWNIADETVMIKSITGNREKRQPFCTLSPQRHLPSCGQSFSHGLGWLQMGMASVTRRGNGNSDEYLKQVAHLLFRCGRKEKEEGFRRRAVYFLTSVICTFFAESVDTDRDVVGRINRMRDVYISTKLTLIKQIII